MSCLHYPIFINRNSWPFIDVMLKVDFRLGPWPYHFLFCLYWLAIRWVWITVSKSLTNHHIEKARFHGDSIDAHFQNGEVTVSIALLIIQAANNLLHLTESRSHSNHQISLTLCWHAVKGGSNMNITHIANIGGQTLTMRMGCSTTLGLYTMQHTKTLTLFSCSGDAHL
jgi:hypothetical protein